jgi:hypothetical protein
VELKTSANVVLYFLAGIVAAVVVYFLLPRIYESLEKTHASKVPTAYTGSGLQGPAEEESNVTPTAAVALLVTAYLIWTLPRRFAVCPLLVMVCLMPLGQQLILLGLHFPLFRLLLLVGALRIASRGEAAGLKWTRLDSLFVWWVLVSLVWGTMSEPNLAHFQNRLGDAYNAAGTYFFVRCVVVDFDDIVIGVRTLAWVSLPIAALMLVEKATAHNLLYVFGGVPEMTYLREGHLRCQGSFAHPILAGTFGATQLPLFAALWFYRPGDRLLAVASTVCAIVIATTASSSGPFLTMFAGLSGLALWKARRCLGLLRWGALLAIACLPIVTNAPAWFLMARLSTVFGGEGAYRSWLIDQAISHFNEWWLFGTASTAQWGARVNLVSATMIDIVNQYIAEGVNGGVLKLGLFIASIILCFKGLGRALRDRPQFSAAGYFTWAIGVSLFTHCFSFISVSYFDQMIVVWFWLLASISCLASIRGLKPVSVPLAREPAWDQASSTPSIKPKSQANFEFRLSGCER